jgi:hypothetical protein
MAIANVGLDDPPAAVELAVRSCRRQQLRQPRQVVGGGGEAEGPSDANSSVAQPLKTMKTRACVIDFLSCISYTGTSYPDWISS